MELDLPNRLRVNRTLKRWSQEHTARTAGLTFYRYRKLEAGLADPSDEEVADLARAFQVDPQTLAPSPAPAD